MSLRTRIKGLPVVGDRLALANRVLHEAPRLRAERRYRDAFLLNTMRKSGSHYLMSILGNYVWFAFLDGGERLDYVALKGTIWNREPPADELGRLREATGYASWRWQHENPLIGLNNARTIVHTYRNPLDAFVSRYFYGYVNREERREVEIAEAIEAEVRAFGWHYTAVRAIAARPNVLRVAYEQLVREPARTATEILEFGRIPVRAGLVERAVEASSADHVRADEQRSGLQRGNLVGRGMTASFIRSGEIGEWRHVLDERHVRRIEELLREQRVSLDEFVLE